MDLHIFFCFYYNKNDNIINVFYYTHFEKGGYIMEKRNVFLSDAFISNKFKEKWVLQMFGTVIFSIIVMLITAKFSGENINATYIVAFSIFSVLWMIGVYFIIIFISSKIMKSKAKNSAFFKTSVTITFIIFSVKLIVSIIQLIFHINPNEYDLLSLNILNSKNTILNSIDFYAFFSSYLLILGLYYTSELKGKVAVIFGIIFLIVNLFFNIFFTLINQSIM